jgi:thiol-disulfide isomerase/thioredoxin
MNRTAQTLLFVAVAAAALAAGFLLHPAQRERPTAPQGAGAAASSILEAALPDLSGRTQRLDQWRGKVLVVNFWATWCGPCRKEIPELVRAQASDGPRGLQIVGIAIDDRDKVGPYAAQMGINYPILVGELDAMDLARAAGNELGGLPFTVVFARDGTPVHAELGTLDQAKLARLIGPLL